MTTPSRSNSPATEYSVALLRQFVRLGLTDLVLSPGSRSQALALAAAAFEDAGALALRVRIDERVGGFLALGLAVESGRPVVIVTTSGTAVANLHPAVLEAHHSGVPLIVISADRPDALRGIGSNQTTEQRGIFGAAINAAWDVPAPLGADGETDAAAQLARDAWAAATAGHRGRPQPVHLNISFTEPLSAALPGALSLDVAADLPADAVSTDGASRDSGDVVELDSKPGTVVIASAGAGERAESLARDLGVPLIAEVSSGAHFGPNLVVAYRELMDDADFGGRIERVILFGHPTLSREVPALVQREGVETIVVRSSGADDYNPGHRVARFVDEVVARVAPGELVAERSWVGRWVAASRALTQQVEGAPAAELGNAEFARRELAAIREPVTRRMLVEALWRVTWPHDRLVLGASRLIREADAVVTGKKIRVHANRGLAGIDGTIATAVGVALAAGHSTPGHGDPPGAPASAASSGADTPVHRGSGAHGTTRVLLGDLAALHDAGALGFGRGEAQPRIQVVVGNDGGGTIFDSLEVAATAPATAMDRALLTPQRVDFERLAAAYGWQYLRATNRGELDQALTASAAPTLIEVPLSR